MLYPAGIKQVLSTTLSTVYFLVVYNIVLCIVQW